MYFSLFGPHNDPMVRELLELRKLKHSGRKVALAAGSKYSGVAQCSQYSSSSGTRIVTAAVPCLLWRMTAVKSCTAPSVPQKIRCVFLELLAVPLLIFLSIGSQSTSKRAIARMCFKPQM